MQARYIVRGLLSAMVALAISGCGARNAKPTVEVSTNTTAAEVETGIAPRGKVLAGGRATLTPTPREVFRDGEMVVDNIMKIYTLPVGAGNCQFMQCPSQNKLIMFDCGSRGPGSLGWSPEEVKAFVTSKIDKETEVVVSISHGDRDHSDFLPTVFGTTAISAILFAQEMNDYPAEVSRWMSKKKDAGTRLVSWRTPHRDLKPNDDLSCWEPDGADGWVMNVPSYILAVNAGSTANDASMVIAQTYGDFQAVFTGDMTGKTQDFIFGDLQVDLSMTDMITGAHHGASSMRSNSPSWAQANQAQLTIFSAGTRDLHPRCESVAVYLPFVLKDAKRHKYDCGSGGFYTQRTTTDAVLVTDTQGLITVTTDGLIFKYDSKKKLAENVGDAQKPAPKRRAPDANTGRQ